MRHCILYLFSYLLIIKIYGQGAIKKYVADHTIEIRTIDPASTEYSDLQPLGNAIGNAQVVMLGEQDHGDAAAFAAKTRIIKYLHEQKGFDVLAFESDLFALTEGWDQVSKEKAAINPFLKNNIYYLWTRCSACSYLFYNYIAETHTGKAPLQITGFDSQMALQYSKAHLGFSLDTALKNRNIPSVIGESSYKNFVTVVDSLILKAGNIDGPARSELNTCLDKIEAELLQQQKNDYWLLIIKNLKAFANNGNKTRDAAMAMNLDWVIKNKYPDKKIIVWAANGHIMKYTDRIKSNKKYFDRVVWYNMGTRFVQMNHWADRTYVIGFDADKGTGQRIFGNVYEVEKSKTNSVEAYIPSAIQYGFVDFKKYNQNVADNNEKFWLKSPSHFYLPVLIPWNKVYDGLFFIRTMYPCQPIQ
ncbi:hypothetical protein A8C56_06500 [Niabella ginsenosidivorans]|uniref:Erythromycin esterase n=1 Tax=Niabella ginsenosidivorans TaxID=1176587 RepID=A0A1A9HZH6_9BACT|nr:erythromycin esterase family protein [Niabella ginsenosidivorans]ANH80673.1 hypothetical protein A8C56_06500 [Niabella ginsenosidivorans]